MSSDLANRHRGARPGAAPRVQAEWQARAQGHAGHIEIQQGDRAARGAAIVHHWAGKSLMSAQLWSGDPGLLGHFLSLSGSTGFAFHRKPHSHVWHESAAIDFASAESPRPAPAGPRLRIALGVSAAALAAMDSAAPWLALWRDAACVESDGDGLIGLASHLLARADLPFALSREAGAIGLELADVRPLEPADVSLSAADPIGPWVNWSEALRRDTQALLNWRRAARADVVILIEDFGEAARRSRFAGYAPPRPCAEELGATPCAWRRLAVVDAVAALQDWTLAHELGHLVGIGHAPSHASAAALDELARARSPIGPRGVARSWARGWQSPQGGLETVMAGLAADAWIDYRTVPLWSEPGLDWCGQPTAAVGVQARGAASVAHDALRWSEVAAAFTAERRGWDELA